MNKNTQAYRNKLAYINEYTKTHCKQYHIRLNTSCDKDIINALDSIKCMDGGITNFVRNAIRSYCEG